MARAACKFIVHFSMSFCTTRTSFRKTAFLLSCRPQPLSTSRPNTPLSNSPAPAAMAGVQRDVFALVGPFKFHSIPLCGGLDSLPRRTTFGFGNALHLLEARDSVADVRGIFQRLLALLGESELGCGYLYECRLTSYRLLGLGRAKRFYHLAKTAFVIPVLSN